MSVSISTMVVSSALAHADVHHLQLQQFAWCLMTKRTAAGRVVCCLAEACNSHMMHTVPTNSRRDSAALPTVTEVSYHRRYVR